jgi:hypothetical protein
MLKGYIFVILLRLLLIMETKANEDFIEMRDMHDRITEVDNAIGNCAHRPTIHTKLFSVNPPVSQ